MQYACAHAALRHRHQLALPIAKPISDQTIKLAGSGTAGLALAP
jgi:hypothetical protein